MKKFNTGVGNTPVIHQVQRRHFHLGDQLVLVGQVSPDDVVFVKIINSVIFGHKVSFYSPEFRDCPALPWARHVLVDHSDQAVHWCHCNRVDQPGI